MRAQNHKITMLAGLFALSMLAVAGAKPAFAKGVEELKPGTAEPPAVTPKSEQPNATEPKAVEPAAKEQLKEEPKAAPKEEPKAERSELSKALDGKLFLGTSLGATTIKGAKGEWSGGGVSEFLMGYKLSLKVMDKLDVWGTFRYQPISATVIADKQSYRATVHSYGFGGQGKYAIQPNLSAVVAAELAYCGVNLQAVDGFAKDDAVGKGGVRMTLGGGAEWKFLEKVLVGPRVNLGLGSFTTMEMAATVALMF